jgi:hypothetical protein
MKRACEFREVPAAAAKLARSRTYGFIEAAVQARGLDRGRSDPLDVMVVSAYLQGIDDAIEITTRRTEGTYELER